MDRMQVRIPMKPRPRFSSWCGGGILRFAGSPLIVTIIALSIALLVITMGPRFSAPYRPVVFSSSGKGWSGYETEGRFLRASLFTNVQAHFVVPTLNSRLCQETSMQAAAASIWVGLGGEGATLEQVGVNATCSTYVTPQDQLDQTNPDIKNQTGVTKHGIPEYVAFYEMICGTETTQYGPCGPKSFGTVSAGEPVNAVVSYDNPKAPQNGSYELEIANAKTGHWVGRSLKYCTKGPGLDCRGQDTSAEVIVEIPATSPSPNGPHLPPAPYGSVDFSEAAATDNSGYSGPLSSGDWDLVTPPPIQIIKGAAVASVSSLGTNSAGSSFVVSSTTTPTPQPTPQPISPGNNSPKAAVDGFLSDVLANNDQGACLYVQPSSQQICDSSPGGTTSGTFSIRSQVIDGTEALVSFTGNACQDGSCASNGNPNAGMPPGAGSFADAYSAAVSAESSDTTLSPLPCVQVNGKWYVNPGFGTGNTGNTGNTGTGNTGNSG
ncbi:MAG: G1 family glutamic endopeptidase [Acidimicrobiales bacterium]